MQDIIEKLEKEFPNRRFSFVTRGDLYYDMIIDGHVVGILTKTLVHSEDFIEVVEGILADGNFQPHK